MYLLQEMYLGINVIITELQDLHLSTKYINICDKCEGFCNKLSCATARFLHACH